MTGTDQAAPGAAPPNGAGAASSDAAGDAPNGAGAASSDAAGDAPNGAGPSPNGTDPNGGDVDAIYRMFLARAAALPKAADSNGTGSVGASQMLLDEIASARLPTWTDKPLATAIANATGLDAGDLLKELRKFREALSRFDDPEDVEAFTDPAAAYEQCLEIAEDPSLLERLLGTASRLGIAGDRRGVISTFLVAISRLLHDPNRMLRKGSPASGKNYVIDKLLPLFNPNIDYVVFTAASAKALFYSQIDFKNKLIIIPEAAALVPSKNGNDEFAMVLRELISSGRLVYHTVQPSGPNGTLVGATLEKEGPVALILTTARNNIEEEMETRLLVTVSDESDAQTKRILAAAADNAAGNGPPPLTYEELAQWRAYQDWLRLGERRVVVPYAPVISGLTNRRAMRIRRDLSAVLSLIKASALMHRAQRASDAEGRIVAQLDDYALAVASLGEGLEELAHGIDTSSIAAVRAVVCKALAQRRRAWGRTRVIDEFRHELQKHLVAQGLKKVADRLGQAAQTKHPPPGLGRPLGCIAFVCAADATIHIDDQTRQAMYRAAVAAVLKGVRKSGRSSGTRLGGGRPESVELSTNQLGVLLGIGRKGARNRLDDAIESGAVIDVGSGDPTRSRTAPKLLAPGTPASPQQTGRRPRTGAFPSLPEVRAALEET